MFICIIFPLLIRHLGTRELTGTAGIVPDMGHFLKIQIIIVLDWSAVTIKTKEKRGKSYEMSEMWKRIKEK